MWNWRSSEYNLLLRAVDERKVEITWINALPRSTSTAFEIALTESSDFHGQIHEPRGPRKVKAAFRELLTRLDRLGLEKATRAQPIRIVVKEMAHLYDQKDWLQCLHLLRNVVTLIRDPQKQMPSLVEAKGNDWNGCGLGWNRLLDSANLTDEYLADNKINQHIIVDSDSLLACPLNSMHAISQSLGIRFHEGMVNGWQKARGIHFYDPCRDGWINTALFSTGFQPSFRQPTPLDEFPKQVKDFLIHQAIPIYQNLRARNNFISVEDEENASCAQG